MDKKNKHAGKGDTINVMMNIIIVILVLAVLGLGAWAVVPKITQNLQEKAQNQELTENEVPQQQVVTVGQRAQSEGISLDEYKAKYGLGDDVNGDTSFDQALYAMNLTNYAAAQGISVEDVRSQFELPESVKDDAVFADAIMGAPARTVLGGADGLNQLKETYGITDIDDNITYGDLMPILQEKLAAQQPAAAEGDGAQAEGTDGADNAENAADGGSAE